MYLFDLLVMNCFDSESACTDMEHCSFDFPMITNILQYSLIIFMLSKLVLFQKKRKSSFEEKERKRRKQEKKAKKQLQKQFG